MTKNHWIIGIIAVIFIFAGFFVGSKKSTVDVVETGTQTPSTVENTPAKTPAKPSTAKPSVKVSAPKSAEKPSPYILVTFTNDGFSPKQIEVRAGQIVRFVNNSSLGMWVASNYHPTNDIYSELNQGRTVGKGGFYDFAFTRVGAWGYHNHVAPSKSGIVIVHVQ